MDPTLYAEYRTGLDSLGQTEWAALKEHLCGEKSAEVLVLFKDFVKAWLEREQADEALEDFTGYAGPDTRRLMENYAEQTRLLNESRYALRHQKMAYYDLASAIHEEYPFARPEYSDSDDEDDGSGDYSD
jgi:hypothetical protein